MTTTATSFVLDQQSQHSLIAEVLAAFDKCSQAESVEVAGQTYVWGDFGPELTVDDVPHDNPECLRGAPVAKVMIYAADLRGKPAMERFCRGQSRATAVLVPHINSHHEVEKRWSLLASGPSLAEARELFVQLAGKQLSPRRNYASAN